MNKLVTVLGVAAVATLAGCKDPNYKPFSTYSQGEAKVVVPEPVPQPVVTEPSCKCAPGARHASPCSCGAADCRCIVDVKPEVKPLPPAPVAVAPAPAPEVTIYIVQNGDYLAKISKKYNVTVSSIKRLNGLKGDKIRIGQKLKLPGKIDVGEQKAPVPATVARKAAKAAASEYAGETKEYVVKNGDTLGAIAYGNGCNIRQLKKLNGLTSDSLKIGQKLKVPAAGKAASSQKPLAKKPSPSEKPVEAAQPAAPTPVAAKPAEAKPVEPVKPVAAPEPAVSAEPAAPAPETPAPATPAPTASYTVQEGDDMTGVSIRFGVSAAAIRELNNLPEDAQLTVGQVIKLPADAQQ